MAITTETQYTTINATVGQTTAKNPVIYQYTNPEIILTNLILEYMGKVGFDSILPNFQHVRVGAEHPFALFLYNDENGQEYDFNILPSITITDSGEDETLDTLGIGYEPQTVDAKYVAYLSGQLFNASTNNGFLVTSSSNITNLQNAVANGTVLSGTKRWMTQRHSIDLEIWAENKNVSALLFDLVNTFILDYMDQMHDLGIDFTSIGGRRSGDFNLDYGRLLYGASITFNALIRIATVEVNMETVDITSIQINPTYTEAT